MKTLPLLLPFLLILSLIIFLWTNSGCSKEYSCEGCLPTDTIPLTNLPPDTAIYRDSLPIDTSLKIPYCASCDSSQPLALNTWSLKMNNTYTCGAIEQSYFGDTEKYTIDFGGHMSCSRDTGFRIVAFFQPLTFTTERFNVSTTTQSLIFQDHTNYMNSWAGYIVRTNGTTPAHTIAVIVDTFANATKLFVGRFHGYAYTKEMKKCYVDGRFRFIIH